MAKAKGSDPIDEKVPTAAEVAEDEQYIADLLPQARAALTDDIEGV